MNKSVIALLVACYFGPVYAAEGNNTFDALFQQAEFWQDKNRNDLAKDALQRVLNADPNNLEAIYRMGMISAREGDEAQVQQWSNRLAQLAPTDPRVKQLGAAKAAQSVDPATLAEARRLGSQAQYDAALKRYQEVFGGSTPTLDLAPEYYLTLAGTKNGSTEAKQQLKKLYQSKPSNSSIKQAYAQVLSYDESSRREGIALLAEMAENSPQAEAGWRQALLWLNASAPDKKLYDQYMGVHSNDLEVMNYYLDKIQRNKTNAVRNNRTRGYQALNANKLKDAERYFNQAISENSRDADAVAGLGLIRLKQQKFDDAKSFLAKAIAQSPAKAKQWRDAYQSAEFYASMSSARQLMQQQEFEKALGLVQPLTSTKVPRAYEAQVLAGQLQHKLGQLDKAALTYNTVLQKNPANTEAKLGLIAVLQSMGRWNDAERLSAQLSDKDKNRIAYVSQVEVQKLRETAKDSNELLAEISLRRAMKLAPSDPWVRLDLARLVNKQGDSIRALAIVEPLMGPGQPTESRYAAAMFASEQERWPEVERIMATIAPEQRTPPMKALAAQSGARGKMSRLLQRAASGDRAESQQLLVDLYQSGTLDSKAAGDMATELLKNNHPDLAYQLVELDLMQGLGNEAGQYLGHINVLNQTGHAKDAKLLMSELMVRSDLTDEDRKAFSSLQQGFAVREADQLREKGQMALAYDVLAAHLREAPEDESLLLAMGRLYESGKKLNEADQIYTYILTLNPASKEALSGAVNSALQLNNPERATELLTKVDWNATDEPELLVLAARVAQARGDETQAQELLLRARKLAYQNTSVWGQTSAGLSVNPFRETAEPTNNPFRDRRGKQRLVASGSRPTWLPGQVSAAVQSQDVAATQSETLFEQIDTMLLGLEQNNLTRIDTDVVLRVRNGTKGTSALAAVETPIVISASAWGKDRVEASITPVSLNSGTVTGETVNLYGRGAVISASSGLSSRLNGLTGVLNTIEESAVAYDAAQSEVDAIDPDTTTLPASEIARLQGVANTAKNAFDNAVQTNLFDALELSTAGLTADQRLIVNQYLIDNYGASTISLSSDSLADFRTSRARLEQLIAVAQGSLNEMAVTTGDPQTQRSSGVALALAYKGESVVADVGTTPLGFEKTNVVGGVKLQPEVMKNTRVVLQGERRAVTDSMLSYAGTKDHVTGETWGAVTKTGAGLGLNFDNGKAGAYGTVAKHKYEGENVESNEAISMEVGGYFRPLHSTMQQLQLGVHVGYDSFDKNVSKFTFGHGGYFSPQNYVSVAFPMSYEIANESFSYNLMLAPGFQSYSEDGNSFYPTDAAAQAAIDLFVKLGAFTQAGYAPSSKSGFGMSFGASGEYRPDPYLRIGGQLGFDSFGDYNESTVRLYMKYLIGGAND